LAEAKQQLLDTNQRLACFFGETFERDQGTSSWPPGEPGRLPGTTLII
jgi:hypothetical protein